MNVWPTLIGKVVVTLWMWQCDNVLIMIQSLYVKTCVTMSSAHCANFPMFWGYLESCLLEIVYYEMCQECWNMRFKY